MKQLPDGVEELILTPEKVEELWEKFNKYPQAFDDKTRGDYGYFVQQLVARDSVFFEFEDRGIIYFTEVLPGHSAKAHCMFFDGKLSGKVQMGRKLLKWVFVVYNLQMIGAEIPGFASALKRFVSRLGFAENGKVRKSFLYNGTFFDSTIHDVIREEVLADGYENEGRSSTSISDRSRPNGDKRGPKPVLSTPDRDASTVSHGSGSSDERRVGNGSTGS